MRVRLARRFGDGARACTQAGDTFGWCALPEQKLTHPSSILSSCVGFKYSQFRLYGLRIYGLFGHMVRFLLVPFVNGYYVKYIGYMVFSLI